MEFFRVINTALMILAWIIVGALAWALMPLIQKLLELTHLVHRLFR